MTVQSIDLVTLSREDLDIVVDALKIAQAHYQALAEVTAKLPDEFRTELWKQSIDAGQLQLKIEASR